ncbi:MAG: hypothetical protein GEV10_04665 [Streptosporangiales bacterium]|nr:hypothetical protein [Streptosporangiales bacterium]
MSSWTRGDKVTAAVLVVVGVGTMYPALGLVDPSTISGAYGLGELQPDVETLLRHRGAPQLALGGLLCCAAFVRPMRVPTALAAIFTKATGFLLSRPTGSLVPDVSPLTLWFDSCCLVVLTVIAARELLVGRVRRRPNG